MKTGVGHLITVKIQILRLDTTLLLLFHGKLLVDNKGPGYDHKILVVKEIRIVVDTHHSTTQVILDYECGTT